jgi:TonB family protein
MSQRRLVWTAVFLVCVTGGSIASAAAALPLGPLIGEAAAQSPEVVEGHDPGVTMPTVLSEVKPQYTPEALRPRIEGTVIMTAVVGADGTPGDISVTTSLDAEYGLDEQARIALGGWRFRPGRKDSKPRGRARHRRDVVHPEKVRPSSGPVPRLNRRPGRACCSLRALQAS